MARYKFDSNSKSVVQRALEKWESELETGANEWYNFYSKEIEDDFAKAMRYADYDSISEFERRAEEQEKDLEYRFEKLEGDIKQKVNDIQDFVSDILNRTFEGDREYEINLEQRYVWEYPGYPFRVRFDYFNFQAQPLLPKTVSASLDIGSFDANRMIEEQTNTQEQTAEQIVQEIANRHEINKKTEPEVLKSLNMKDSGVAKSDFGRCN